MKTSDAVIETLRAALRDGEKVQISGHFDNVSGDTIRTGFVEEINDKNGTTTLQEGVLTGNRETFDLNKISLATKYSNDGHALNPEPDGYDLFPKGPPNFNKP